jgi:hypothetical protein
MMNRIAGSLLAVLLLGTPAFALGPSPRPSTSAPLATIASSPKPMSPLLAVSPKPTATPVKVSNATKPQKVAAAKHRPHRASPSPGLAK